MKISDYSKQMKRIGSNNPSRRDIVRAVLKAQEIERHKIGLELHDNINQILVTVRLYIDAIEREDRKSTRLNSSH